MRREDKFPGEGEAQWAVGSIRACKYLSCSLAFLDVYKLHNDTTRKRAICSNSEISHVSYLFRVYCWGLNTAISSKEELAGAKKHKGRDLQE